MVVQKNYSRFLLCFYIITIFFVVYSMHSYAQIPQQDYAQYTALFPNENAIYTKYNETVYIDIVKNDIRIKSKYEKELFFTNNNAAQYNKENIYYNDFFKIQAIKAHTRIPNGNKYTKKHVKTINDSDVLRSSFIFHDDIRVKKFVYEGLEKGSFSYLSYEQIYKEPHFFGSFNFQSYIPIVEGTYTIYAPKGVEIGYVVFGEDSVNQNVTYTTKTYNKGTQHIWNVKNMPKMIRESNAPNYRYYASHIQVYIKKYHKKNGEEVILYNDVSKLHSWYADLLTQVPQSLSSEFISLCDSIATISVNEEDKVRNVFYWVQDNIYYIAFEAGLEGFIPRGADAVFEKRYGDCKDMSNLIVVMLKQMGVKAHHTWIGSRDIPYTYHQVPTTSTDNHMIATYIDSTNTVTFLDATSKLLPFGMPSEFIQGKQALINDAFGKPYHIETVPIINSDINSYIDTSYLHIEDRGLYGENSITLNGYVKQKVARQLQHTNEKDTKEFLKRYTRKGNNTFNIVSYTLAKLQEREQPMVLETDFSIQNILVQSNNDTFINLNIDGFADRYDIRKDRHYPIENDYAESFKITNILTVPDNYTIQHIPENSAFSSDLFDYSITYEVDANKIYYTLHITNNATFVTKHDFELLNNFNAHLKRAYKESIIITKQ